MTQKKRFVRPERLETLPKTREGDRGLGERIEKRPTFPVPGRNEPTNYKLSKEKAILRLFRRKQERGVAKALQ